MWGFRLHFGVGVGSFSAWFWGAFRRGFWGNFAWGLGIFWCGVGGILAWSLGSDCSYLALKLPVLSLLIVVRS